METFTGVRTITPDNCFFGHGVFSSQDIVTYLKGNYGYQTSVVTITECIIINDKYAKFNNLQDIPLKYAVAYQKYKNLKNTDVKKITLINACKICNIYLYCTTWRVDAFGYDIYDLAHFMNLDNDLDELEIIEEICGGISKFPAIYPIAEEDQWIISASQNKIEKKI